MGQRREIPAGVSKVRARIEHWRKTRAKRSPMPEPLWDAAVALAKAHGVHRMSEALRVSYDSLKARVARGPKGRTGGSVADKPPAQFVELKAAPPGPTAAPQSGAVVELVDAKGTKLIIRMDPGADFDLPALVRAFQNRRA